jgi:thiamine biosynthesis lipoprotein
MTAATMTHRAGRVQELTFPVMGTEAQLLTVGATDPWSLERVGRFLLGLETRWSRFRPDSELSRLNGAGGRPVSLPADTFALVEAAIAAWRLTGRRFDPTVLPALLAAGYDRSFDLLTRDGVSSQGPGRAAPAVPGCAGIELDARTGLVRLPPGVALDLGGIAKGHAADRAVAALLEAGAAGALANLGGDLRVAGEPPDGRAWTVAIDDPHRPGRELGMLRLADGAVATSSRTRRRWPRHGNMVAHHIIDPATGAPADRDVDAAVVVTGDSLWAEVLAKAAVIAGRDDGAALLRRFGATGLLVSDGGEVVHLPGVDRYLT